MVAGEIVCAELGCDDGRGLRTCHCAGCHRTFTRLTGFDRHLRGVDPVVCTSPAELGMVVNSLGYWYTPATAEDQERLRGLRRG